MHTFFWHDYETFGADPRRDRPAQFAGIRTDADLNEIGEPVMIYCRPAPDYLPDPESCLLTGITPQLCLERGLPEHEFAARIEAELARPGTIGVGYNTIRFDDEITRFMFWRNLIDPYAREWQNECGRWDLLDVVRLTYALRPDGIEWPRKEDGSPSLKLEHLSRANGLVHEAAHDALSDVRATIALARLIRERQPRLFEFALGLRRKDRVAAELRLPATADTARPFLHVSGMFPADRGCLGILWPLASHPTNRNELIAWDLAHDPSELAGLDAARIRERLFTRTADLPEGVARLPVKSVHLNKSPHGGGQRQHPHARDGAALGHRRGARRRPCGTRAGAARHERDLGRGVRAAQGGTGRRGPGPVRRLRRQRGPAPPAAAAHAAAAGAGAGPAGFRRRAPGRAGLALPRTQFSRNAGRGGPRALGGAARGAPSWKARAAA